MVKIVAELGINHNGDLSTAKKLISTAKAAGCDYVKFQKRCIDQFYSPEELNRPFKSPFGDTLGDYKRGREFGVYDYDEIDKYCRSLDIQWFVSPWDTTSIETMTHFDNHYFKIPSALITNMDYLAALRKTNIPLILSTGMSTFDQIATAMDYLGTQVEYILHCTSTYPSKPHEQDLNVIHWLKDNYPNYKIGFSNHFPGLTFMIAAVAMGAEMVEFHMTLDRSMFGTDHASSIEPEGTFKIVKHIRALEEAMGDGVKKVHDSEYPIMEKLRR